VAIALVSFNFCLFNLKPGTIYTRIPAMGESKYGFNSILLLASSLISKY